MIKIAIIGMDIAFEGCADVTAFERSVYAAITAPDGAVRMVRSSEQVADGALRDAGLPESTRVVARYTRGGSQSAATPHMLVEAERLLVAGEADAVLIVEQDTDSACAVVVARAGTQAPHVYATVNALRVGRGDNAAATCAQALADAGVTPADVGYLEAPDYDPAQASMKGILAVYRTAGKDLTCALGSVYATTGTRLALAGLLKTALCLYRRYLPPVTSRIEPQDAAQWSGSPFYTPSAAHPWLLENQIARRFAAVDLHKDDVHAHIILEEPVRRNAYNVVCQHLTENATRRLFPLAGDSRETLHAQLAALQRDVESGADLGTVVQRAYGAFQQKPEAVYAVAIVGHDAATTLREIAFALAGLDKAFKSGKPWASPQGSYFTPAPLGREGHVAFVYPGAFNAYLDMGRDLFQVFPRLHELFTEVTARPGHALAARHLYPRSRHLLSEAERRARETELWGDPLAMISSGTSLAILHTRLLRDIFGVQPRAALGYSLGEVSMLWAFGVWRDGDAGNELWRTSPLFTTRLCGPMEAVRESWKLPDSVADDLWHVHILKAPFERVQAQVAREPRVYLTITNTPQEVVIAGDPQGCARVITVLDCHTLRVPFDAVIHNETTRSEHDAFVNLYTHPTYIVPGIDFYSAAGYRPLKLDRNTLAQAMADMSGAPVDFPRLVHAAYAGGARVFVELGPQGTCSRWIRRILADKPHAVIPINRPGAGDYETALAVLALLVSHRVPVDLSPLYALPEAPIPIAETPEAGTACGELRRTVRNRPEREQYLNNLSQHAARVAEGHTAFLEARQTALQQTSKLLQMQATAARQIVSTEQTNFNEKDSRRRTPLKHESDYPTTRLTTRDSSHPRLFGKNHLEAFAIGAPEGCFGTMYAAFGKRRIPRIPNGDLLMMSRILEIDGRQGEVQVGAGLVSEYDVPANAWFYREGSYPALPYALLMEIALQPCGFLSAYLGSILPYPDVDFYFRNLDGEGTLHGAPDVRGKTLTNRVMLTASTAIQGIIVQKYTYAVACEGGALYEGTAAFGYFTPEALENQVGLDGGQSLLRQPVEGKAIDLRAQAGRLRLLEKAVLIEGGGHYGRGYVHAEAPVTPQDWFLACHFHEDPVMPGSLGVEAMLQAMQVYAQKHGLGDPRGALPGHTTTWKYRGQVPPEWDSVMLEVHVADSAAGSHIIGDASLWRKGRRIYEVKGLGLQLAVSHQPSAFSRIP
jgi:PfaB family protein